MREALTVLAPAAALGVAAIVAPVVVHDGLERLRVALARHHHHGAGALQHGREVAVDEGVGEEVFDGREDAGALPLPAVQGGLVVPSVAGPEREVAVLEAGGNPVGDAGAADERRGSGRRRSGGHRLGAGKRAEGERREVPRNRDVHRRPRDGLADGLGDAGLERDDLPLAPDQLADVRGEQHPDLVRVHRQPVQPGAGGEHERASGLGAPREESLHVAADLGLVRGLLGGRRLFRWGRCRLRRRGRGGLGGRPDHGAGGEQQECR
ncbi:MAG TPA: hypothetical protein EYQ24_11400 [Bacteroidetes bacterium]|nr:hypothetical protein [Bacteroidota bacterium]